MLHQALNRTNRAGFTLVEMAIIFVIIGLLVGGILGIRSYGRNAQLTTMMNEAKLLMSAFNQFQARYGSAPGDFAEASATWAACAAATSSDGTNHNGNGNGFIRANNTAPGNRTEWFYAFQHLGLSGFINGSYTGATTGGGGTYYARVGTNVMGASVLGAAFLFDGPDIATGGLDGFLSGDATYFDGQYTNVLQVAAIPNGTSMPTAAFLTPKEALQLDEKFDDGRPGLGMMVTPISTALANCATTAVASTALYSVTNEGNTCYFMLRMQ